MKYLDHEFKYLMDKKYYDLIKDCIGKQKILNDYQFDLITRDRGLADYYFKFRVGNSKRYSDAEVNYLIDNREYELLKPVFSGGWLLNDYLLNKISKDASLLKMYFDRRAKEANGSREIGMEGYTEDEFNFLLDKKYYRLIKAYISAGWGALSDYRFKKITENPYLIKYYFRVRNRQIKDGGDLEKIEREFLINNPGYFKLFDKDGLLWQLNDINVKDNEHLVNVIIDLYGDDLDKDEFYKLITYWDNSDYVRRVYREHPDWFDNMGIRSMLVAKGILDRSEVDTVFRFKISLREIAQYFKNVYNSGIIEDILMNGSEYICRTGGGDQNEIYNKFVDSDNRNRIDGMNRGKFYTWLRMMYNVNFSDFIKGVIGESVYEDCHRIAYNELKKALSYYGDVVELNQNGAVIVIDLSKFKLSYDLLYRCGNDDLECHFKTSIFGGAIKKPELNISVVDKDKFNRILASKLDEMEASS
jgi:hypothetical protein